MLKSLPTFSFSFFYFLLLLLLILPSCWLAYFVGLTHYIAHTYKYVHTYIYTSHHITRSTLFFFFKSFSRCLNLIVVIQGFYHQYTHNSKHNSKHRYNYNNKGKHTGNNNSNNSPHSSSMGHHNKCLSRDHFTNQLCPSNHRSHAFPSHYGNKY